MKAKENKKPETRQGSKIASTKKHKKNFKELENQEEQERNGVLPGGLDFKKFLGCGG